MSDIATQQIVPKINDQYWFDYSENLITNGLENRNKAAASIQSFVLWLWGIYTVFASIGFGLSGKALASWDTLVIALASASLIAVYGGTVWVQIPVSVAFDPRSPNEIEKVYLINIKHKNRRLQLTLGLLIIAAIMVSISLIIASVAKPQILKEPGKAVAPTLSAAMTRRSGGGTILSVTSLVDKGKTSSVTIQFSPVASQVGIMKNSSNSYTYIPSVDGLVQASIPIDEGINEVLVSAEWKDDNETTTQLSKKVTVTP